MAKEKKDIRAVVEKEFPEFAEECETLDVQDYNNRLAQLAKDSETVQDTKDADEELEEALQRASELGAPYRDTKKIIRLKSRYLIALIKERSPR